MTELAEAVNLRPGEWRTEARTHLQLLRRATPLPPGKPVIRIDMSNKYYKDLVLDE